MLYGIDELNILEQAGNCQSIRGVQCFLSSKKLLSDIIYGNRYYIAKRVYENFENLKRNIVKASCIS